MRSWLPRKRVLTTSAPACDALRGVCTISSVVRGWLASLGTVGPGHVYLYAVLQNNLYGLAWLLNGDDVSADGEGPTAHACLDLGSCSAGRPRNSATSERVLDSGLSATMSGPLPAKVVRSGMVVFSLKEKGGQVRPDPLCLIEGPAGSPP